MVMPFVAHKRRVGVRYRLNRREALKLIGGAVGILPVVKLANSMNLMQAITTPRNAPNFIFILTDDQQQAAMSAYGNKILNTPNMDRIGSEGIRFTEAFVTNSLCAPSRASILTGLYSHAHGVVTNGAGPTFRNQPGLKEGQVTFAHLLRQVGYHTALVGKWHIPSWPTGFEHWVILPGQGVYQDPEMIANGVRVKFRGHVEDVVGDQALTFLQQRPKDKPFCLLCQFKAPHRSWFPATRFEKAFEDVEIPVPRTFEDRLEGRPEAVRKAEMAIADMPDFRDRGVPESLPREERKRRNFQLLVKNYYRVLLGVDENVGRVLDFLDKNGLTENTVIVYTSDNGFFLGEHGLFDKRLMYEPSIRVPMMVRFPAGVKAGCVDTAHMVLNIDVAPTLLELAGVPVPVWMHGRSWLPLLEGHETPWRDAFLYEYYEYPAVHCVRKNRGVRTNRWKLIHFWEQPEEWELYDLHSDSDETNNLAVRPEHAERIKLLRSKLEELRREVGDVDPPGPAPSVIPCTSGIENR
jgi:arylsulfatase A-like enzyme